MKKFVAEFVRLATLIHEDGIQVGLQRARDAIGAPQNKLKISGAALAVGPKKKRKKAKRPVPKPPSGGMTVEQSVLDCIEINEGKTGAEIIKLLPQHNARTIRTMLRRLRLAGKIEKVGEGWFKK